MTHKSSQTSTVQPTLFTLGYGEGYAQYGEIFQGQIYSERRLRRCLLSLPCKSLRSTARFHPNGKSHVQVLPSHKEKALKAAILTLEHFALRDAGGVLTLQTDIPEAKGCGSSTADCIAAVMAVADSVSSTLTPPEVATLVVSAELASGNMMYQAPVLFAHREGLIIEQYSRPLPIMEVLAFDTEKHSVVNTLEMKPAEYTPSDINTFRRLTADLRQAIEENDLVLLGHIATASATINQRFLPKRHFDAILTLARHINALGIAVAHSGTVMSLLLAADDQQLEGKIGIASKTLEVLGIENTLRFTT